MKMSSRWIGVIGILFASSILLNLAIFQIYSNQRERAIGNAESELTTRAQFLANSVDRVLQARMIETFTFAALPSLRAFAASDEIARLSRGPVARDELRSIISADEHIRAVTIVDVNGIVIMTTNNSILADWSKRLFVREALAGHLFASPPSLDDGEIVTHYSAPILNNAGDVAGALVLRVNANEMNESLGTYPDVMLVDEEGVRIADRTAVAQPMVALAPLSAEAMTRALSRQQYGAGITQIRATNLVALRDEINRGRATPYVFTNTDGKVTHAAMWRLKTNFWSVVVMAREDHIIAPAREMLGAIILVAAISIIGALAIGFFIGRAMMARRESAE